MNFLKRSVLGLLLLSLTAGLVVYGAQMLRSSMQERAARVLKVPKQREREFAVRVVNATGAVETPVVASFGEVQSQRILDVRATASGRIVALSENFVEGGRVSAGELLFQVDDANARSTLDRLQSDQMDIATEVADATRALDLARDELRAAEEQRDLRQRALERQKDLRTRNVGTEAAVEAAELALSSADQAVLTRRRAVDQALSRIEQTKTRVARTDLAIADAKRALADTRVVAEFDGTLSGVTAVAGGVVSMNERVAQLIDPARLEVVISLATREYTRVLDEQGKLIDTPVRVVLDVLGQEISAPATLEREGANVGEGRSGRILFASLENAKGFKPGDFVSVEIEERALENVVRLPASAVNSQSEVLVVNDESRLETRKIEVLRRNKDDVLARAPMIEGMQVVAARSPVLGGGIKVKVIEDGAKPAAPELVELTPERRQKLISFVEQNGYIPKDVKSRLLTQLAKDRVPAKMVNRLESRMGG